MRAHVCRVRPPSRIVAGKKLPAHRSSKLSAARLHPVKLRTPRCEGLIHTVNEVSKRHLRIDKVHQVAGELPAPLQVRHADTQLPVARELLGDLANRVQAMPAEK